MDCRPDVMQEMVRGRHQHTQYILQAEHKLQAASGQTPSRWQGLVSRGAQLVTRIMAAITYRLSRYAEPEVTERVVTRLQHE